MENQTDCPLPPRRFRSKLGKLLFSLYDSYITYAFAVIILTICYAVIFTLHYIAAISFDEFMVETKGTVIYFDKSISRDQQRRANTTYHYKLSYYYDGKVFETVINVRPKDAPIDLPTKSGADIIVYVHSENPSDILLFPPTAPSSPILEMIGILIFAIVPAWIIQQRRNKLLAMLPLLEMGIPIYAEITKKNIAALANSAKKVIQYPLEFVAFDGETYNTIILAAPRAFQNKPVLLLYKLSNPNEFIVPNAIESPPKFNADGTISPYFGHNMINALLIAISLSVLAGAIFFSFVN